MTSTSTCDNAKKAFEELIIRNHQDYGLFFETFKHNHGVHLLGSLYDMGATEERMRELYEKLVATYLAKMPESKYSITEHNYQDFYGNDSAYRDLTDFFEGEVSKLGFDRAFQKYVPTLLPGLGGHIVHPLIHLGYAVEFRNDMVLAEALAFATLAYDSHGELIDTVAFKSTSKSLTETLEQMNDDSRLNDITPEYNINTNLLKVVDETHVECTGEYLAAWDPSFPDGKYSERVHELSKAITLLFLGQSSQYRPNFFLCHLLTGLHATRSILPQLMKKDQIRALRLMWLTTLQMHVAVRSPKVSWENISQYPTGSLSKDATEAWVQISQAAVDSEDVLAHVIKSVRALKKLAEAYPEDDDIWKRSAKKVMDYVKNEHEWGYSFD
ncbi:hypothetical protein K7432_007265 [Basidiobolus ranarum]|uniref:Uncharacterized protein n=1 Tax=Basidiobolus ranarum TaxID=34480 RepID=A0ABR2WTR1_9FUNG